MGGALMHYRGVPVTWWHTGSIHQVADCDHRTVDRTQLVELAHRHGFELAGVARADLKGSQGNLSS